MPELVHKASPQNADNDVAGKCRHCGVLIKRVPGGQGPTWVHVNTGAVAGPGAPLIDSVYVVRRDDPLDYRIDVFVDYETAQRFARAADGTVIEEPILHADDEYVLQYLAAEEAFDDREEA